MTTVHTQAAAALWMELAMQNPDQMTGEQDLEQLTCTFRLLSDKTRLSILLLLCKGELNVTTLCNMLKLPQPTVSHHLGLLRMNNMIGNRRSGKQIFYTLNGAVERDEVGGLQINMEGYTLRLNQRRLPHSANGLAS